MVEESEGKPPEQDSDYDGAWKEALRNHFPEFLSKYFPGIHGAIDWEHPIEWYDKEVSQVLGQPRSRNKRVDLLVKVWLQSGQLQWVLVHLEVQSGPEPGFERRIAKFNSGLFWVFDQRVVTVVVLADLHRNWRPREDVFQVADFETRIRYPICKLVDKLDDEWTGDTSLPVQLARAQVAALRTASDPEGRFRAKWQLVRNLYAAGYNRDQVRELFRLIDWMMHLPEDLSERFAWQLTALEESLKMPYVTSVERIAKAKGEAEGEARGEAKGRAAILLHLLAKRCGPLPEETQERVRNLTTNQLVELADSLFDIQSLDEVRGWLDRCEL